jgi:hypothetical protein
MLVKVSDSILWDNNGQRAIGRDLDGGWNLGGYDLRYSDSQDDVVGNQNVVHVDPEFLSASATDPYRQYRLSSSSPLQDTGTYEWDTRTDLEGTPRSYSPDIGAFESP